MAEHEQHGGEHEEHEGGHGGGHGGGGHGGGGHAEGEHEGAPEWLISFADNVALMMGFFVILLAMNMNKPSAGGVGGEDKNPSSAASPNAWIDPLDTVIAIREAFNAPISSTDPRDRKLWERKQDKGKGESDDNGQQGEHDKVQNVEPTDDYNLGGVVPFDEGKTDLSVAGQSVVQAVASKLKGQRWVIEVRGHASPFETFRDAEKGLDLSYARAKTVASALVEQGLLREQLHVVACGDIDRVAARSASSRADIPNRRVEIVVTKEVMAGDPYTQSASGE